MNSNLNIKVFVVDDDNLTIDLLAKSFFNSSVIEFAGRANSGEECLLKLKNKTIDLILMDINMPGIDGIETAEILLKEKQSNPPKIIFLTVYSDYAYTRKAFDLKASIIGKNIGIEYLLSTIERVFFGEIVINPNPNGITKQDDNAKLKFVLKNLLNKEQIRIACKIRNGKTAEQIAEEMAKANTLQKAKEKYNAVYINNQKKEIYRKLKPLCENMNAALLGAIMERSGLCQPLVFENLDSFLPKLNR